MQRLVVLLRGGRQCERRSALQIHGRFLADGVQPAQREHGLLELPDHGDVALLSGKVQGRPALQIHGQQVVERAELKEDGESLLVACLCGHLRDSF